MIAANQCFIAVLNLLIAQDILLEVLAFGGGHGHVADVICASRMCDHTGLVSFRTRSAGEGPGPSLAHPAHSCSPESPVLLSILIRGDVAFTFSFRVQMVPHMSIGWPELLLLTALIGQFFFVGLFTIAERRWPDGAYPQEAHLTTNMFIGGTSALTAFLFLQSTQDLIAEKLSIYDVVDFSAPVLPSVLTYVLCFLFIDFIYYALHRLSHHSPILWRLHKVHHSDDRMTASTGLVHHPLEALFIGVTAFSIYVIVNMPVGVILFYGAINSLHIEFVHSNM
jgi:sterol desaturase/sphingolipid hydroxylase (fatty acid hydroxylase superfamily)